MWKMQAVRQGVALNHKAQILLFLLYYILVLSLRSS